MSRRTGPHILVFDVGTSAVKTALFDAALRPAAVAVREYPLQTRGVCVEARPDDYLLAMRSGAAAMPEADIAAIGMTTQGETLVPVDAQGAALTDAIVWLDARAQDEARLLRGGIEAQAFYETTGLPEITPALPLAKLLHLRERMPDVWRRAAHLLLLEDYLRLRLTGETFTHASLLTSTGYFDIRAGGYWREALALAGVCEALLPPVLPSGAPAGRLTREGAALLGLTAGIPVYTGAMDQTAALLAASGGAADTVCETVGTAHVVAAASDAPRFLPGCRVTVYRHALPGRYLYLPIGNTAGMALKWFRREFGRAGEDYAALDALCATAPAGCEGVTFLPFLSGCADPEPLPEATACLFGLRLSSTRAHAARAVLEAAGYELRLFLSLLDRLGCRAGRIVSLGGGARSALWTQMRADIAGLPLETPAVTEATAAGAALLAAWGAGIVPAGAYPPALTEPGRRYVPDGSLSAAYAAGYDRYRSLFAALRPLYRTAEGGAAPESEKEE